MRPFRPLSTSDQLAQHLREEILSGRLTGAMPGINQLVRSLGVNSVATTKALQQLELEGLLISQGRRRKRLIAPLTRPANSSLRIGFLHYDEHNELRHDSLLVRQALVDAGHSPFMAPKTMYDLGMSTSRIAKMINSTEADAWVVYAGPRETLEFFAKHEKPAFAIYGRFNGMAMPAMGIRKQHVDEMVIKRFIALGHRRIVWMAREERRKPHYGAAERFFLEQLEAHGIQTGPYNIPDWDDTPESLKLCLENLFKHTPPTAMVVCDPILFHAIQVHLAHRGVKTPDDISFYCQDFAETFEWTIPTIAHIQWDHRPFIRRLLQWAKNLSQGREDMKQSYTKAKFIEGDSIAPPKK